MRINLAKLIVFAIAGAVGFAAIALTSTVFNARSTANTASVTNASATAAVAVPSIAKVVNAARRDNGAERQQCRRCCAGFVVGA